ncbi:MAG: hypothetical protein FWG36_07435 [Oscillospiraceae bacterium]|nr:hypothetical protein [Oscillospiraceae bacterium]
MNLSRVKTYLIIILLAANVILAVLFGWRFLNERAIRNRADEQLIELLAAQGVNVGELPSGTAAALVLSRDLSAEGAAAAALLGECEVTDISGGRYRFESELGWAVFQAGGRFEISLHSGITSKKDYESTCREILGTMGFSGASKGFLSEAIPGGGFVLTFGQGVEKHPLYNAIAAFDFSDNGQLLRISGVWALGSVEATGAQCKSAGAILLLLAARQQAEIRSIEQGFRLILQTPDSSRLSPEWRVVLEDGDELYLDGFTGIETTAGE